MRMQRSWVVSLMVLLLPSLLCSAQAPQARGRSDNLQAISSEAGPESPREIRIFALRYQQAEGLARIIGALVPTREATITADGMSQNLVVAASPDRLQQIERVIQALDRRPADKPNTPQVMYRVYMVELPSKAEAMKPFSLMVDSPSGVSASDIMDFAEKANIQLTNLDIVSNVASGSGERKQRSEIEGRAASPECIQRLMDQIPGGRMQRLNWQNEAPLTPPAQSAPLPSQIAEQIRKLLGADTQTVGYWFGNLSAPGRIEAPIGPWVFQLEVDTTPRADQIELEVSVAHETPGKPDSTWRILSNAIRGNLYRPVIIGYNRNNYGTRTMGALVIVPSEQ